MQEPLHLHLLRRRKHFISIYFKIWKVRKIYSSSIEELMHFKMSVRQRAFHKDFGGILINGDRTSKIFKLSPIIKIKI